MAFVMIAAGASSRSRVRTLSLRPLAMAMRSMGRWASSASFTAWMPVNLSMGETVYS